MPQAPNACLQAPCMDPMARLVLCSTILSPFQTPQNTPLILFKQVQDENIEQREPGKQRPGMGVPTCLKAPFDSPPFWGSLCALTLPLQYQGQALSLGTITALPCTLGMLDHSSGPDFPQPPSLVLVCLWGGLKGRKKRREHRGGGGGP